MKPILSGDRRDALLAGYAAGGVFGPDGDDPFVAIALAGTQAAGGAVLRRLPCPVIGIGEGPLAAWCDVVLPDGAALAPIAANIAAWPRAATVLVQTLRATEPLAAEAALVVESLAYATLQTGAEFRRWRAATPAAPPRRREDGAAVIVERDGDALRLTMNRAAGYNAIDIAMRDALVEALQLAAIDRAITTISIAGNGRCFSIGGDVAEFGATGDPSEAHAIRSVRSPAVLLADVAPRLTARLHGAVIGAGVEMAAFAGQIVADRGAWFQLPELRYGLIPGAGGTVSLPRRIGRQRTAYLALSMRRISAATALAWGLVDAIA